MEDGHSSSIGLTPVSSTADMLPDSKAETAVARNGLSRRSYGRERCNWPRVLEITGIVVAVAVIWMVFLQVLTAFYCRESTTTDRSISPVQNGTCLPTDYSNSLCVDVIQQCLFASSPDIVTIATTVNVAESTGLLNSVSILKPSSECEEVLHPFLCLHLFKPCGEDGQLLYPSSDMCTSVRDQFCSEEWTKVELSLGKDFLPVCESLPLQSACNNTGNLDSSGSHNIDPMELLQQNSSSTGSGDIPSNDTMLPRSTPLICNDGFVNVSNRCLPHCPSWKQYPYHLSIAWDAMVVLASVVNILASVIVLMLSCIRYKRMFAFPTIFVIYQTVCSLVMGVISLISFTDRGMLFCTSSNWIDIIFDTGSSPFCTFSGAVYYYITWQLALFWFFHIVSIFFEIRLPFQTRSVRASGRIKYIHSGLLLIAVLFPLIPVMILIFVGGFSSRRFPPFICSPGNANAAFYSTFFPLSLVIASGSSLMIGIVWIIVKKAIRSHKSDHTMDSTMRAAIIKLLVLFFYIMVLAIVDLVWFSVATQDAGSLRNTLSIYFECESAGIQADREQCRLQDDYRVQFALSLISFVLLLSYPVCCLLYAVNISDLKEKLCSCVKGVREPRRMANRLSSRRQNKVTVQSQSTTRNTEMETSFVIDGEPCH